MMRPLDPGGSRGRMILVAGALLALAGCRGEAPRPIVVGSKNFTEQVILAELLAQQVEARAGLPVERRVNLGGTWICHRAITAGEIDVYVEYTGTALTAILKEPPVADPGAAYSRVKEEYARRFDLEWLSPLGFDNTFAMVVRGADARKHRLRSISDVARVASRWRPGFGYEFLERPDGYRGLVETYGLRFGRPPRIMDLGLIYRALKEGRVDIVAGNSTDGAIAALDLVALEDDRRYFPPYEAAAVARAGTLDRHPSVREALESLAGILSAEDMRRLNDAVDGRGRHARAVAEEFRRERGL